MHNNFSDENILGRIGDLVVKIADCPQEVRAAQRLRQSIFFNDDTGHDEDRFDLFCDHLIVVDCSKKNETTNPQKNSPTGRVVATYRLLGQERIEKSGGFYAASEFDISPLLDRHEHLRFLEFGRSCVLPEFRNKRTIELLWHGSWAYVKKHKYDVMFGCASFDGVDPKPHMAALQFLNENASADESWQVESIGEKVSIERSANPTKNMKQALRGLPPLIKGYLRLGAMFAPDAVVDRAFNSIDVLVLLPIEKLNPRYVSYYGENAERHSTS